ncbi:alpha-L-fucosidase [Arthrobacter sp. HLT1-20]
MVFNSVRARGKDAPTPVPPSSRGKSRKVPAIAGLATLCLVGALMIPSMTAQAATSDSLNVGFNGSLVGTTAYTTTGSEIMHGVLNRVTGNEEQVALTGVRLTGGAQGIRYAPTDMTTGTDTADQGFLGEVKFTPASSADMSTIFSAGGNFYIRAQSGELRYGFDSLTGSNWTSNKATIEYPALNKEHALSFHYLPTATGATLSVMLDGVTLPPVTSTAPAKNATNLGSIFGFGYEVNPGGSGRGFSGMLHDARLAQATGAFAPSAFEYQPKPASTDLLDVSYDGALAGNAYTATGSDVLLGTLNRRAGTETVTGGKSTLTATGEGLDFTATAFPLGTTKLDKGFVAEATFTPSGPQVAQAPVIAVGGNLFARYNTGGTSFEYGFSSNASGSWKTYSESVPVPEVNKPHTFSMVYVPKSDGTAELVAGMDGKLLAPVTGAQAIKNPASNTTATFGAEVKEAANNRAFKGSLDKTRFAALTAGYEPAAVKYQDLTPGEPEVCEPLLVDPANYISVSTGDCEANILAKSALVRPTKAQLEWQESRQTAFLHFGINTFYNQEWGHGNEDPARFNPTDFDADSWVKTLRDNGYRYAVLTVKHHDGFMSYPSRYTDYTVASSPWKNGKGDVVKEFTDAAHKYGMKVGLYMSPADSNQEVDGVFGNGSAKSERTIPTLVAGDDRAGKTIPSFKYQATDYGAFFLNTLYEILTQYGQVDEVWFDGAQGNTGKREFYDYPAFYDMIAKLQPQSVVAVGGNDVRWIGNEQGVARANEWAVLPITRPTDGGKISAVGTEESNTLGSRGPLINSVKSGQANSLHWWPGEADMRLTQGWFAHPNDAPKQPAEMMNKYYQSVGRNSVLLLNVPPTTTGKFAPASVTALQGFKTARDKSFSNDLALGLPVLVNGESTMLLTDDNARTGASQALAVDSVVGIDLGSPKAVSNISLSEHVLEHGQTVEKFTVEAKLNGTWTAVNNDAANGGGTGGGTIGVTRILKFAAPVTAQEFRVTIKETRAPAHLSNLSLYSDLAAAPAPAMNLYVDCKAPLAGIGTEARPFNSLEQFRQLEIATGATIHFKAGTDCAASDTPFWGYGTAAAPITVTSYGTGAAALIGGKSLAEKFGAFANKGWKVAAVVEPATPTTSLSAATVEAGKSVTVTLAGFAASQEVTLELRPGAHNLGKVTTNAQGGATIAVTVPVATSAGDFTVAATQGAKTASAALKVTAPVVVPTTAPPTTVAPTTAPPTVPATTAPPTVPATTAPPTTVAPTTEPTVPATTAPATTAPASNEPAGTVSQETVAAGSELTMTGQNFKPGSTATFTLHSDPVVLGSAVVAANGTVSLTVKVPAGVPAGGHTIVISGTAVDGGAAEVSIAVTVGAAGGPTTSATSTSSITAPTATSPAAADKGDLAHTGATATSGLLLAMVLLLAGSASVLMIRRRGKRA